MFTSRQLRTRACVLFTTAFQTLVKAQTDANTCVACFYRGIPEGGLTIGWRDVETSVVTVATATVVIDTDAGLTSTISAPVATVTADSEGNVLLGEEDMERFWASQIAPESAFVSLRVIDGKPTATVTALLPLNDVSSKVVTGTIVFPSKYEHLGFAVSSIEANTCSRPTLTLAQSIFGLTPTATNAQYTDAYDFPLGFQAWSSLLPDDKCYVQQAMRTSTGIAITQALAVTNTITSYGVVVNQQESTAAASVDDENEDSVTSQPNDVGPASTAPASSESIQVTPDDQDRGDVSGSTPGSTASELSPAPSEPAGNAAATVTAMSASFVAAACAIVVLCWSS